LKTEKKKRKLTIDEIVASSTTTTIIAIVDSFDLPFKFQIAKTNQIK
jgi:hypothetical protein